MGKGVNEALHEGYAIPTTSSVHNNNYKNTLGVKTSWKVVYDDLRLQSKTPINLFSERFKIIFTISNISWD